MTRHNPNITDVVSLATSFGIGTIHCGSEEARVLIEFPNELNIIVI